MQKQDNTQHILEKLIAYFYEEDVFDGETALWDTQYVYRSVPTKGAVKRQIAGHTVYVTENRDEDPQNPAILRVTFEGILYDLYNTGGEIYEGVDRICSRYGCMAEQSEPWDFYVYVN